MELPVEGWKIRFSTDPTAMRGRPPMTLANIAFALGVTVGGLSAALDYCERCGMSGDFLISRGQEKYYFPYRNLGAYTG